MKKFDPIRHKAATAVFKLAVKTSESAIHRTVNREPKGKGWVQCQNAAKGMMCKPEKVKESIEYLKIAYEVYATAICRCGKCQKLILKNLGTFALWRWSQSCVSDWGRHASNALHALHSYAANAVQRFKRQTATGD